MYIVIE